MKDSYELREAVKLIVYPHYKIGRTMIDRKYKELFA